ncbi:hypothetical protein D3C85_1470850 [compost metagenome]
MPSDHQLDICIQYGRNIGHVMHQQSAPSVQVETQKILQRCCPGLAQIIVPAHNIHRGNSRQLIENVPATDVPRMNDPLTPFQRRDGFGAKQAVGIGNHANLHAHSGRS